MPTSRRLHHRSLRVERTVARARDRATARRVARAKAWSLRVLVWSPGTGAGPWDESEASKKDSEAISGLRGDLRIIMYPMYHQLSMSLGKPSWIQLLWLDPNRSEVLSLFARSQVRQSQLGQQNMCQPEPETTPTVDQVVTAVLRSSI